MKHPEGWTAARLKPTSVTYSIERQDVFWGGGLVVLVVEIDDAEYQPGRLRCGIHVRTCKGQRLPHPREVGDIEIAFGIPGWGVIEVSEKHLVLSARMDPLA